jgi:ATP-binding protein involved in chromosome partitioning
VIANPDGPISAIYKNMARQIAIRVGTLAKDMSSKFPNIVVQNT